MPYSSIPFPVLYIIFSIASLPFLACCRLYNDEDGLSLAGRILLLRLVGPLGADGHRKQNGDEGSGLEGAGVAEWLACPCMSLSVCAARGLSSLQSLQAPNS